MNTKKIFNLFRKTFKWGLLGIVIVFIILLLPPVQSYLASFATKWLNDTYKVDIQIDKLSISPTGMIVLDGVLIRDTQQDTLISAEKIRTPLLDINELTKGNLYFSSIYAENLFLDMKTYKGDSLSNLDVFVESFEDGSPKSNEPFIMKAKKIHLKESRFRVLDYNSENPQTLDIQELFADVSDFYIFNSNIDLELLSGSLVLDNHLKINDLKLNFCYSDSLIRLDKIYAKTPHSEIDADIDFFAKNGSYSDFLNKVNMNANIRPSVVGTDDINGFSKVFAEDKVIDIQGVVKGHLNGFSASNIQLDYQNTSLQGLVDMTYAFSDKDIVLAVTLPKFTTIYSDLVGLMPDILGKNIPEELKDFGFLEGTLRADYFTKAIDIEADMYSSVGGDILVNGGIFGLDNPSTAVYRGKLVTNHFRLGDFLKNKDIGKITTSAQITGKGLDMSSLDDLIMQADIKEIEYRNYSYKNIRFDGAYDDKKLNGTLRISDSNLKMSLEGLADISKKEDVIDIKTKVELANLNSLGFVKNDSIASLKGEITVDVKGNSFDELIGRINFKNTTYNKNQNLYKFEDFFIDIQKDTNNIRTILVESPDIITGKVQGRFKFAEINKIFQNSIGSIYTNYKPFKVSKNQYLTFDFKIYNKIIEIFLPELVLGKNTLIRGKIAADEADFKLNFKTPNINIYDNKLKNVNLIVDNKNPLYNTYIEIQKINTNIYDIQDFNLINTTIKDTLFFRTEFKGGQSLKDNYVLNFYHTINEQRQSVVGLKKSSVFFKDNEWVVRNNNYENKLIFDKNLDSIHIKNFNINHQDESISLNGILAKNSYKDIHLIFDKVELYKITPDIKGLDLEGNLNGHLSLVQRKSKYYPSSNLIIKKFALNKYDMGDLELGIEGNEDLTTFNTNLQFINGLGEGFRTIGDIAIRDGQTFLELDTSFKELNLSPFSPLADGILSNIRGNITGAAHISGRLNKPKIEGTFYLNKVGMGIPYLNVDTNFAQNSEIILKDNDFIFNDIQLTDVVYKTQATLGGKIYHKKLTDWYLDISLDTKNKRFLALNTQAKDNDLFYGTGFINGKATLKGSVDDITIGVKAVTGEGTKFKIPLSDTQTVGDDSFIIFKSKEKAENRQIEEATYQGIKMNFDLDILPTAEVEIIIDQKNNSNLIGSGAGTILMEIDTNGQFNMWGDFLTTSGEYNFKYGGVIDKKFKVLPNGSITWNGAPMSATLNNLKAAYTLYANPSVLLESTQYNRKIQTQVVISLEGDLSHPQTIFDIKFPDSNPGLVSEMNYRLEDTDKKQLQAFALLAQGNFLSDASAGDKVLSYNMMETATGIFNQLLASDDDKLNLGISYEAGAVNPNQAYTSADRLGLTFSTDITDRILFNGKFKFPIGGVTQTAVSGDFEFQFLLNKEKTLSAKIFNRENEFQQYLLDRIDYTQGIGLSYKVDFDTFRELWRGIFRKNKEDEEEKKEE
ncbi:MAG: translocation/assembly module TamB domain-containing protein [Capnocytophaga sp.]|nr:translocation/assembly module TamB domain-containing protein [Capnocytophaga sp.]